MKKFTIVFMTILAVLAMNFTVFASSDITVVGDDTTVTESTDEIMTVDGADENAPISKVVSMYVAEKVTLPLNMTMTNNDTKQQISFTVNTNGDGVKIDCGTYTIDKVTDGKGKKLTSGATLQIDEDSDTVYLDFTKPQSTLFKMFINFLRSNLVFLIIAGVILFGFKIYKQQNGLD